MKFSHALIFFVAGIIGVLLGGLFLGLILDRFFSGELKTGDMATWAAAFGTICTLGFLINQHTQLREMQKREKKEREAHEKKQQEMWASQAKMLTFQKYQNHKELLRELLEELEHEYSVVINEKSSLYRKLFPNNNSEHCDVKVEMNSLAYGHSSIALMDSLYDDLTGCIKTFRGMRLSPIATTQSDVAGKIYDDYLVKLFQFASLLHVELSFDEVEGSTYPLHNPSIRFSNIFIATRTFEILESIYINISHFCGNEVKPFNKGNSIGYSLAKLHHFFTEEHHHYFSTDKGSIKDELDILWQYFLLLSHEDLEQEAEVDRTTILEFFDDDENYGLTKENPAHLTSVLQVLLDSCGEIEGNPSIDELNNTCKKALANLKT
ncbi:hypothetical protein [Vibrio parahaemolyticus]|uniref:hypothetical protein n=1 Tax=Vibrio parahaemolyticus TaxID=670 RepID=UPI00235DEC20|nr:hypothetical protein [Vibrio parahaemolyticus]